MNSGMTKLYYTFLMNTSERALQRGVHFDFVSNYAIEKARAKEGIATINKSKYDVLVVPEREDNLAREEGRPVKYGWKVSNISVPTQTEIQDYIGIFGYNPFEAQCEG